MKTENEETIMGMILVGIIIMLIILGIGTLKGCLQETMEHQNTINQYQKENIK